MQTASAILSVLRKERELDSFQDKLYYAHLAEAAVKHSYIVPKSYKQTLTSPQRLEWQAATDSEIESFWRNKTGVFVDHLPEGKKALPARLIYKIKFDPITDEVEKFKARLVVGGDKQVFGLDFNEVYSPTISYTAIRLILSFMASRKYHIHSIDITTAFLYSILDEEVYIHTPAGFHNIPGIKRFIRLLRSLYGLRQAPRNWTRLLCSVLSEFELISSSNELCLFSKRLPDGSLLFVLFYVDDIIIGAPTAHLEELTKLKTFLLTRFKGTDAGPLKQYVRMQVDYDQDAGIIRLGHNVYIEKAIAKFESLLGDCISLKKVTRTPMRTDFHNRILLPRDTVPVDQRTFQKGLGTLVYLSYTTRPDISCSVNMLARFGQNPLQYHLDALVRVYRYLFTNKHLTLSLGGVPEQPLMVFSDSDHASDADISSDRRSRSGHIAVAYGGSVNWFSKLQTITTDSSGHSEYVASYHATICVLSLRSLMQEIRLLQLHSQATRMFIDNKAAETIMRKDRMSHASRHFEIKYHYQKQFIDWQTLPLHIPSADNLSDMFTKPLPPDIHIRLCDMIMNPHKSTFVTAPP
jgi:hypothetical protein